MGSMNLQAALHKKILQLIIFPTEKCNFRCTYCYEDFEIGKMKRPIIDGLKKLIQARIERGSLEALNLAWFGGEPLLAKDVMFELAAFAKDYLDKGILKSVTGDTTTNAYLLTEPVLRRLVELRQTTFQISLDGYGEGHNVTRKRADGRGTFDVIWANLLAAKATDLNFQITLRLHLTSENAASMERLVDEICEKFGGDQRFSIFFKTIENLGGPNNVVVMDKGIAAERAKAATQKLNAAGLKCDAVIEGPESSRGASDNVQIVADAPKSIAVSLPNSVAPPQPARPTFNGYICYASKPNSLIIRADGSIGKCTVMLSDSRNRLGKVNPDGTITLDNEKMHLWMRGFKTFDPLELGCPAQNLPKLPDEQPLTFKKFLAEVKPAEAVA